MGKKKFIWEGITNVSPLTWWRGLRGTNVISDIAIRILSAPVTSAATERTFSTFSWIHSSKRNRLTTERAAKIAYISHNWRLKNKTNKGAAIHCVQPPNIDQSLFSTPSTSTGVTSTSTIFKNSNLPESDIDEDDEDDILCADSTDSESNSNEEL